MAMLNNQMGNYNDLTLPNPGIMAKGKHLHMALFQVSEIS